MVMINFIALVSRKGFLSDFMTSENYICILVLRVMFIFDFDLTEDSFTCDTLYGDVIVNLFFCGF